MKLADQQREALMAELQARFEKNKARHPGIAWADVESRLLGAEAKLWSLHQMEETGGEPDVVGRDDKSGEILFYDCAKESPKGRRSLCFDRAALNARKEHKPANSAEDMAQEMGAELLSEEEYQHLQSLGEFDLKTSSWLKTPDEMRALGGGLFGDRRFGRVFFYHNGVESYYAARGFRVVLRV